MDDLNFEWQHANMITPDPNIAPWPFFSPDEVAAVTKVLQSGHVNYRTGGEGKAFEAEYAAASGAAYALTVANGTAALELALEALGIGAGDEVIVPARTFISTAAAVVRCGAKPVIADIDRMSQNLTKDSIEAVLSERSRAVIPVHLAGWPADMESVLAIARTFKLAVIEDCAQAHGASYKGQAVGTLGDIGCFSFCQDKIISTGGEGGLVLTNDTELYKRMWSLRDHGWDYDKTHSDTAPPGFRWLVDRFATNWRMTESQSAIGRLQLRKLNGWVERRRSNAKILTEAIRGLPNIHDLTPPPDIQHSYYKYYILLKAEGLAENWTRDRITEELNAKGVPARVGACPDISKEAAFANTGIDTTNPRPNAAAITDYTIMLPVHPTLTEGNMTFMANHLNAILATASR